MAEVRELMSRDWNGMEQKIIQAKRNIEKAKRNEEKAIKQAKREKQRADTAEAKHKLLLAERARLKSEIEKSSPL